MEAIWNWDLRWLVATVVALAGAALALRGGWMEWRGMRQPVGTRGKNLLAMRGLRLILFGMPFAVAALGWWLHQPVFVAAGLVIAFEETLEISIVVWDLRQEANGIEGYA